MGDPAFALDDAPGANPLAHRDRRALRSVSGEIDERKVFYPDRQQQSHMIRPDDARDRRLGAHYLALIYALGQHRGVERSSDLGSLEVQLGTRKGALVRGQVRLGSSELALTQHEWGSVSAVPE